MSITILQIFLVQKGINSLIRYVLENIFFRKTYILPVVIERYSSQFGGVVFLLSLLFLYISYIAISIIILTIVGFL